MTPRESASRASRSSITDSAPRRLETAGALEQLLFQPDIGAGAYRSRNGVVDEPPNRRRDDQVAETVDGSRGWHQRSERRWTPVTADA